MLSFGEIVEDFSAPDEDQTLVTIAGLLVRSTDNPRSKNAGLAN